MKRLNALFVAVASVLLVLAGCSSPAAGPRPARPAATSARGAATSAASSCGGAQRRLDVDAAASAHRGVHHARGRVPEGAPGHTVKFEVRREFRPRRPRSPRAMRSTCSPRRRPTNMDTVVQAGLASNPTNFVIEHGRDRHAAEEPGEDHGGDRPRRSPGVKVATVRTEGAVRRRGQSEVFKNAKITVKPTATAAGREVDARRRRVRRGGRRRGLRHRREGRRQQGARRGHPGRRQREHRLSDRRADEGAEPALAKAWVDYVLSPAGQKVMQAAGFNKP